nr:MAG TPA: hypothetical protein [Caudoviricetes sp.]
MRVNASSKSFHPEPGVYLPRLILDFDVYAIPLL